MWQEIKHPDIPVIKKAVGEYKVRVLGKKFRIKVFLESSTGLYTGYANLRIKDEEGNPFGSVGIGRTEEGALRDAIAEYIRLLSEKSEWKESDFEYSDPFDF